MNIIFYCKTLIFGSEGTCLVLMRSKDQRWDLPGGAVAIPENHEHALRREVKMDICLSREHSDFRWVTEQEFKQLDIAPHLKDLMIAR